MRLEYPHSLSYQPTTLTSVPSVIVDGESRMQECGLCTMSIETIGAVLYSRMPFIGPSAAAWKAALTSSTVTSRLTMAVKSVSEPSGVGTRSAKPSSLPASSGSTRPTALAAPVVVGMIESAAARARRRSRCGASAIRWSAV